MLRLALVMLCLSVAVLGSPTIQSKSYCFKIGPVTDLLLFFVGNGCVLDLPNLSFFAPLVFTLDGILVPAAVTQRGSYQVSLKNDDEVLLSCSPNFFKKMPTQQFLKAKCSGGQELS